MSDAAQHPHSPPARTDADGVIHERLHDGERFFPGARECPGDPFYIPRCSCGWEGSVCRPHGLREGLFVNHRAEALGIPGS